MNKPGRVLLGVATVGISESLIQRKKAAKKQRQALRLEKRRSAIGQIRQARRGRATAINVAGQTGVQISSAALGISGRIGSQLAGNLSFLDESFRLQAEINKALSKALTFETITAKTQQILGAAASGG